MLGRYKACGRKIRWAVSTMGHPLALDVVPRYATHIRSCQGRREAAPA